MPVLRRRLRPESTGLPLEILAIASLCAKGLYELRVDWGPGYRVYYAMIGRECVLLLCGGDKRKQSADIERALEYLEDFKERSGTS
jgi:putative addiction module killer protein